VYFCVIDVQPIRLSPDELPALAFGSHYSVFKERPGTHQSSRCWCRVCRRTVPDELLRRRVSFGCRRAWVGRSDGSVTLADVRQSVNASKGKKSDPGRTRSRLPSPIVAGHPPSPADARSNGPVPFAQAIHGTRWWHAVTARRMPPGARSASGFPSPPAATGA
jgi:hypothetical protein